MCFACQSGCRPVRSRLWSCQLPVDLGQTRWIGGEDVDPKTAISIENLEEIVPTGEVIIIDHADHHLVWALGYNLRVQEFDPSLGLALSDPGLPAGSRVVRTWFVDHDWSVVVCCC